MTPTVGFTLVWSCITSNSFKEFKTRETQHFWRLNRSIAEMSCAWIVCLFFQASVKFVGSSFTIIFKVNFLPEKAMEHFGFFVSQNAISSSITVFEWYLISHVMRICTDIKFLSSSCIVCFLYWALLIWNENIPCYVSLINPVTCVISLISVCVSVYLIPMLYKCIWSFFWFLVTLLTVLRLLLYSIQLSSWIQKRAVHVIFNFTRFMSYPNLLFVAKVNSWTHEKNRRNEHSRSFFQKNV